MAMETRALSLVVAFLIAASGMSLPALPQGEDHILLLVNRDQPIHHQYVPEVLIQPDVAVARGKEGAVSLRPVAAAALEALFGAALKEGVVLYAVSGYRSYATQSSLFRRKVEAVGEKQAMRTVAPPGTSEHQLGLAMDVNGETTVRAGLVTSFGDSDEGKWVAENAHHYGFIIRYPKGMTDITGYSWEPWHLRYVGLEAAEQVHALGITFEEYHTLMEMMKRPEQDDGVYSQAGG